MSKDEALKAAIKAMGNSNSISYEMMHAIADCKEALAQDEQSSSQEPVAKVVSTAPDRIWLDLGFDPQDEYEIIFHELHDVTWSQDNASGNGIEYVRADTTSPKRPWVGLTDDEIAGCAERMEASDPTDSFWREFARAIEAAHDIKENT